MSIDKPAWLDQLDGLSELADNALHYFETAADPVIGMYSEALGFRVVHQIGGDTFYNSNRRYSAGSADQPGDILDLGNSLNARDGQRGKLLARVLAEVEKPAAYAHYLVFAHTYRILVE